MLSFKCQCIDVKASVTPRFGIVDVSVFIDSCILSIFFFYRLIVERTNFVDIYSTKSLIII